MLLGDRGKRHRALGGSRAYTMPETAVLEYGAAQGTVRIPETKTAEPVGGGPPEGYVVVKQNYPDHRYAKVKISDMIKALVRTAP